ncbi:MULTISPECIES: hypothetical protein [unclassified Variovorax]|uniref:hypothetical protein n=1 Tax=unclassified Variovorax TaxID=663243 RepID=UPI0015A29704
MIALHSLLECPLCYGSFQLVFGLFALGFCGLSPIRLATRRSTAGRKISVAMCFRADRCHRLCSLGLHQCQADLFAAGSACLLIGTTSRLTRRTHDCLQIRRTLLNSR